MEKVSLREYSKRHKLSYFNVMKMVRNGDIKSEKELVEGKEVWYVLLDDAVEKEVAEKIAEENSPKISLEEENMALRQEIIQLKEALERCNKRSVLA